MIHMSVPGHPEATLEGYILDENGKKYKGGKTYVIDVPLSRLPRFTRE